MQRKPLNDLKGRISKTHPKRQSAPSAHFFSKSGTKPHRNLEGPQNGPHARKRLISLGSPSRYIPRRPGKSRFRGPPLFLLHSVSGQALWAKKVSDQPSRLEQSRDISQNPPDLQPHQSTVRRGHRFFLQNTMHSSSKCRRSTVATAMPHTAANDPSQI